MSFTWFQAKTLHTSIIDTSFFFFQTFFWRIQIGGGFFSLNKKKRLHHFNEFIFPSHENTGKFILELLTGLRSGELPHRMNTVATREKPVAAVCSREGSRVRMWLPPHWERVFSLPGSCYHHSRTLVVLEEPRLGNHWALSITPTISEPTDQAVGES